MSKALTVQAHKFSGKAAEKLAAAGGAAEVLASRVPKAGADESGAEG
jgi:ribosomal protein L18E